jgi:hypothetical protein
MEVWDTRSPKHRTKRIKQIFTEKHIESKMYINYTILDCLWFFWIWLLSPHSDTLSRFSANQSLLLLLNTACLAEKQPILILMSLILPDWDLHPRYTTPEANAIPAHCHLLDFDSYAPCNNVMFSQSTRGFHFLSLECPENWLEIYD